MVEWCFQFSVPHPPPQFSWLHSWAGCCHIRGKWPPKPPTCIILTALYPEESESFPYLSSKCSQVLVKIPVDLSWFGPYLNQLQGAGGPLIDQTDRAVATQGRRDHPSEPPGWWRVAMERGWDGSLKLGILGRWKLTPTPPVLDDVGASRSKTYIQKNLVSHEDGKLRIFPRILRIMLETREGEWEIRDRKDRRVATVRAVLKEIPQQS